MRGRELEVHVDHLKGGKGNRGTCEASIRLHQGGGVNSRYVSKLLKGG